MRIAYAAFAAAAVSLPAAAPASETTARFEPWDLVLSSGRPYANPFRDVRVWATATAPSGRALKVAGFCDGEGRWRVRLSFDETGTWRVTARAEPPNRELELDRVVEVVPSSAHGPVRLVADRADERFRKKTPGQVFRPAFEHADGTPFFHAGDTSYVLLALDRRTQLAPYLDRRARQGFTHIRMQPCQANERFPHLWPWGGSRQTPDLDRFNPAYFAHLDEVMHELRKRGLGVDMIVLNHYPSGGPMNDTNAWTRAREEAWLRYLVARYAAFDNVVYWTLANEFETHPDAKYRLDDPGDISWARHTAAFVKSIDPYRHPFTVHPVISAAEYIAYFGRAPEIDVLMLQTHGTERRPAASGGPADGDGRGMEFQVLMARDLGKPVVVGEYGYEWDGVTKKGANAGTDLVRRHTWRIVMAGGHFSAGFRGTVFNFEGMKFDVANNGGRAADQLAILITFFKSQTEFMDLEPRFSLVSAPGLALQGRKNGEIVVYVAPGPPGSHGREVTLDLRDEAGPWAGTWLDTVTGKTKTASAVAGGGMRSLRAPWAEAVLHLRRVQVAAGSQQERR